MDKKKLSVYLVTYNRKEYLEKCIRSVLAQSYTEFDLYILDNCSDDGTEQMVKSIEDERIHYIRHEKNIGGVGNINYAISICETEFFVIFHDDDIMFPNFLESELQFLEQNEDCALVSCNCSLVDKDGVIIRERLFEQSGNKKYTSKEFLGEYIYNGKYLVFPTIMYRTAECRHVKGINTEVGPCGDVIYYTDIGRNGYKLAELPETLIGYRSHLEQDSSVNRFPMTCQLVEYMKRTEFYKEFWEENVAGQKKYFRRAGKATLISLLRGNITVDVAKKEIETYRKMMTISKQDVILFYILLLLVRLFPKLSRYAYREYKKINK